MSLSSSCPGWPLSHNACQNSPWTTGTGEPTGPARMAGPMTSSATPFFRTAMPSGDEVSRPLFRRFATQFACPLHLAAQPFRRDVKAVRPSRGAELKKNTREISFVAQRLQHRTGLLHKRFKIVHAAAAVSEVRAQAKAVEFFEAIDLSRHRDLLSFPMVV